MRYRQAKKIVDKYTSLDVKAELFSQNILNAVFFRPVIDGNRYEHALAIWSRRRSRGHRWEMAKRRMDQKMRERFPWYKPESK